MNVNRPLLLACRTCCAATTVPAAALSDFLKRPIACVLLPGTFSVLIAPMAAQSPPDSWLAEAPLAESCG